MGKKKPPKTRELSVAIAEATLSSAAAAAAETTEAETKQQQQQHTPRKRGRPRKTIAVEKTEPKHEEELKASEAEEDKTDPKRSKPSGEVGEAVEEKEDNQSQEKGPPITRSRARRKSYKPRKSSWFSIPVYAFFFLTFGFFFPESVGINWIMMDR